MIIPKSIKESIKISGKHNAIAVKHNNIVRSWLEENAPELNWQDWLIDSLEQSNDGSESLISFLERNCDGVEGKFVD